MINNYLAAQIKRNFSYEPTEEQEKAIRLLADFLMDKSCDTVFVLRGYAGTGKTSLVGALVRTLQSFSKETVLMAPTGRAAKVFAAYSGHAAFTIHKKIYRQRSLTDETAHFSVNINQLMDAVFIVDEASMIANDGLSGSMFGTGRLLDDLIEYVYSGIGCRLILLGDTAQLPPVGEELSPALFGDALRGYNLRVMETELTQVVRQEHDSGILWNATRLRTLIAAGNCSSLPKIRVTGFADIRVLPGNELIETLTRCYERDGMDETIVVCRSNKRANIYNKGVRAQILWREDELNTGDLLMVAKNNYYWTEQEKGVDFIANGETAVVRRVRRSHELYGFRFVDVLLAFPDCNDLELTATLLLDTLHSDTPALSKADAERLYYAVLEEYAEIPSKRKRMEEMRKNPYYNALQVKYAYAVTCHKAQGGQWKNVFLDQGYMDDSYLTPDYFRWLYTAFTRATETLYLVNYPPMQVE
ncbi:MAG: AAA family ATPase [Mediterranea sp.]|jgi:exodeoxyribonuclease-5|nr:AAA family ATPase [Mediterranea sp.]